MSVSQLPPGPLHPAQRRYLAEDLIRRRRSDERRRYAAPQRAAKVDANPHQIDAVIFALARVREGGCILADEVGLGKTIEAGLVIAQLMAEGARRVLLIAPKPLLGQWRQELFQLFDIEARAEGLTGEGVFLIGREAAGSERGRDALLESAPFDLCIIDEAHEVFAGIYKRFDKDGNYRDESPFAQTAGRVREVLHARSTPVLLLTATPIQNSLAELWGLVQYVDPFGTLLGDLSTFREVFCGVDDRQLAPGQEEELRSRLRVVVRRTLRRQVQEFLEKPFVDRRTKLFEYTMSASEKALYDDVTRYLLEPGIVAFRGRHGRLTLLGFHRRIASSTRAFAASLENVAARLRRKLAGEERSEEDDEEARRVADDLEDEDEDEDENEGETRDDFSAGAASSESGPSPDPEVVRAELRRVGDFIQRAEALHTDDGKFRALLQALTFVTERARNGHGSGKLVIFTESLVTQEYLRVALIESRLITDAEITLFRGTNASPRAREALARWREATPQGGSQPSTDVATRLALVHEFKTRARVFISTEAGAKGLNLQFCDTVVNYDLPWNPQRIEQRIGRCHRYGQQHDVTVINFLARDNEAQRLTFEILSQKLELFGAVLDASDHVLHRPDGPGGEVLASALGAEFEAGLRRIYERARTLDEVAAELRALRDKVSAERRRFEETHARTAGLIEQRFDEGIQSVFRSHQETVPAELVELDRDLLAVVLGYLDAKAVPYERVAAANVTLLRVSPSVALPGDLRAGTTAALGPSKGHASLHLNHPLVVAAVADARAATSRMSAVVELASDAPEALRACAGKRGSLRLVKLSFDGFEQVECLVPVVVLDGGEILDPSTGEALLRGSLREVVAVPAGPIDEETLADATQEVLFSVQAAFDAAEHGRFERALQQAERFIEDRLLVLNRRGRALLDRLEQARQRRDGAIGSAARTEAERAVVAAQVELEEVEVAIGRLEQRDDPKYLSYQERIQRCRYTPPSVEHLFDMEVVFK